MERKARCVSQRAYAKINLMLDVGGRRPDGFHDVAMVMQSIALRDEIKAECLAKGERDRVVCNLPHLAVADSFNIAWKAVTLMRERFCLPDPIGLTIKKRIPVSAGLAGGSTDAAAALNCMNILYDLKLSTQQLMQLGEELGSDVPFCIMGGTCTATGRGERVARIDDLPEFPIVLIKPDFSVSTPWAYRAFDEMCERKVPPHTRMTDTVEAIRRLNRCSGGATDMGEASLELDRTMVNTLEGPVITKHPEIGELLTRLRDAGAFAARMSGSGPTAFGLFAHETQAREAANEMRRVLPSAYRVILSRTGRMK